MFTGNCKFCGDYKDLCDAHIIPKVFFRQMDGYGSAIYSLGQVHYPKNIKVGYKDHTILCADCDNKIGILDNYGQRVLLHMIPERELAICDRNNIQKASIVRDYNYDLLKAFVISLLYRASITRLPEFKLVSLGDKYETLAKHYINKPLNIPINYFEFVLFRVSNNIGNLNPATSRIKGLRHYEFPLLNYKFIIKVDSRIDKMWATVNAIPNRLYIVDSHTTNSDKKALKAIISAPVNTELINNIRRI